MPQVKFVFSKKEDLFNIWETCRANVYGHNFSSFMPKSVLAYCRKKSYNQCKKFISDYYAQIYSSGQIELFVEAANKSWKLIGNEYFRRLNKITGKSLSARTIYAYPTLASRCPYNPKKPSFMVNFFASMPTVMQISGHEIMHFHFHEHYFENVRKKVGSEKTRVIKEALTVLLNLEFKDLWFVSDKGYEPHQKLRKVISKQWKKDKNFDKLVEKCIEFVKRGNKKDVKQIKRK